MVEDTKEEHAVNAENGWSNGENGIVHGVNGIVNGTNGSTSLFNYDEYEYLRLTRRILETGSNLFNFTLILQ